MRVPHNSRGNTEGGMHQGGGPRDFQAVTAGGHKWVVYSNGQSQVGATRIPLAALPASTAHELGASSWYL